MPRSEREIAANARDRLHLRATPSDNERVHANLPSFPMNLQVKAICQQPPGHQEKLLSRRRSGCPRNDIVSVGVQPGGSGERVVFIENSVREFDALAERGVP